MDQVYVKAEDGKQSVSKYVEEVASTMLKLHQGFVSYGKPEKESKRKKKISQQKYSSDGWQIIP